MSGQSKWRWPWSKRPVAPEIPPSPHWAIKEPVKPEPEIQVDYTDSEWSMRTMSTKIREYWERHR